MKRPHSCPKCHHTPIAYVLYGYPNFDDKTLMQEVEEGKIVLGGCVVYEDRPTWQCTSCGFDFPDT